MTATLFILLIAVGLATPPDDDPNSVAVATDQAQPTPTPSSTEQATQEVDPLVATFLATGLDEPTDEHLQAVRDRCRNPGRGRRASRHPTDHRDRVRHRVPEPR